MARILKQNITYLQQPFTLCAAAAMESPAPVPAAVSETIADIRREACAQAEQVVGGAQRDGYESGYAEGRRLALEETQRSLRESLAETRGAAERAQREARQTSAAAVAAFEEEILPLGLRMAEALISHKLSEDDGACLSLIGAAASRLPETDEAVLRLGDRCFEAANRHKAEVERMLGGVKKLTILCAGQDDGLCVIETPFGSVDAGVKTQLARVRHRLGLVGRQECL